MAMERVRDSYGDKCANYMYIQLFIYIRNITFEMHVVYHTSIHIELSIAYFHVDQ